MATKLPALLSTLLLLVVGCSEPTNPGGQPVCHDSLSGACIPCPGVAGCVHPQTCLPVACAGQDVDFGWQDGQVTDGLQADAATGDGGGDDATAGEDGAADSAAPDGAVADGLKIDAVAAVDTFTPACVLGQKSCLDDKSPAFCYQGAWLSAETCKAGTTCKTGQCACAGECLAIGQLQCLVEIPAYKTCQLVEGCLTWSVPLACKPGEVCAGGVCKAPDPTCQPTCPNGQQCVAGKCVSPPCDPPCAGGQVCELGKCVDKGTGSLGCSQIFACIDQFSQGPTDQVTVNACVAKGSEVGQAAYSKRKACIALSCQTYIDKGQANEAMLCVYTYCADEQIGCFGSGTDDCQMLAGCIVNCGSSTLCLVGCHASASLAGAKNFYSLQACASQNCPGKTGPAWSSCAEQNCKSFLDKCAGGTLSCGQILQCASGCSDKPCAQACKAKGSAQGIADLQKLLDCSGQACGVACGQGTQQQCDACMATYCKGAQAACT